MDSQHNLAIFLAGTDSENEIKILHRKGQISIWTKLSSLGQEPTFNTTLQDIRHTFLQYTMINMISVYLFIGQTLSVYRQTSGTDPGLSIACQLNLMAYQKLLFICNRWA